MTETSSCSCTDHSPHGDLSRSIYEYISPWLRMLASIHRVDPSTVARGWVLPQFERRAELDSAGCSLNCTTRALFCLPSSGVLIHSAQAFKVPKPRKLYCRTSGAGDVARAHRRRRVIENFDGPFRATMNETQYATSGLEVRQPFFQLCSPVDGTKMN